MQNLVCGAMISSDTILNKVHSKNYFIKQLETPMEVIY